MVIQKRDINTTTHQHPNTYNMAKKQHTRRQSLFQLGLFLGILIFLNILANAFYGHIDLTEDKRFTLTPATKQQIKELDDIVYIESFLEGDFPSGFKRLQTALGDLLNDFKSMSGYVECQFTNPSEGTVEEINAMREELKNMGIFPVNLQVKDTEEYSEKLIFPAVLVRYKGRGIPINVLENNTAGTPPEVVLNNSISLLEYKLTNAIQKLKTLHRPKIAITEGHGELKPYETADFDAALQQYYEVERIHLDSFTMIPPEFKLVIMPKPRQEFSDKDKFKIDQFVMNGGRMIWLIDRLSAELDSMRVRSPYIPFDYPLNLDDILFKYGVRIQPNMVLDIRCSRIPLQVGQMGNAPQYDLRPWYYNPIIFPKMDDAHPIVKNLDGIDFSFVSSIDTIKTKTPVKKTVLLTSSDKSRLQFSPARLSFEIARYKPELEKFDKPNQPVAVLLEGEFPSLYENRVTDGMTAMLDQLGQPFKATSRSTKMIVIADGDVVKNPIDTKENKILPLGLNRYEKYTFANKDFLLNAVEYLLDTDGVIASRSKEVKLRLLNKSKAKAEKTKWQMLNIVLPLVLLFLFALGFNFMRRRRYA